MSGTFIFIVVIVATYYLGKYAISKMEIIKRLLIKGLIYSYKMDRLAFEIKKFK